MAQSAEFQFVRQAMPLARNDTVFVYFSSAFFEGLFSPQYSIELQRRMKSVTDIELLMLARLAARGEQIRGESPEDLAAAELLPRGFGRRPDGSGPVERGGQIVDSLRGARGTFTPIPDVAVSAVTKAGLPELQYDGTFLGGDRRAYSPDTPIERIPPFGPREGPVRMEWLLAPVVAIETGEKCPQIVLVHRIVEALDSFRRRALHSCAHS